MNKALFTLLAMTTTLITSAAVADPEAILAHVKVCPEYQGMMKSQTVTVTEKTITFVMENGPQRIQMGLPATTMLSFPVLSYQEVGSPLGLITKKGLEVKYQSRDSAGPLIEKIRVYESSVNDIDNGTMKASACK